MAKSKELIKARQLRQRGESIKRIAKILSISKSTVSLWCRDIELTSKQIQRLHDSMVIGGYKGRLKGARIQKERKEAKIRDYLKSGLAEIGALSERETLIAGLCIYWGEGSRKSPPVRLFNSDQAIVMFMMKWFRGIFKISEDKFLMYVTINEDHRYRLAAVIKYWSRITGISEKQFRKPILIKAKNKKIYENFNKHYGTLCIRIAKSTDLYYKILGLIEALKIKQKPA